MPVIDLTGLLPSDSGPRQHNETVGAVVVTIDFPTWARKVSIQFVDSSDAAQTGMYSTETQVIGDPMVHPFKIAFSGADHVIQLAEGRSKKGAPQVSFAGSTAGDVVLLQIEG